jgi:hypothetical protein
MQNLLIEVTDGSDYEHLDQGPHVLILGHGQTASFALGTNTASGDYVTVTQLAVELPRSGKHPLELETKLPASASTGKPIHFEVTAFLRGSTGPPTS